MGASQSTGEQYWVETRVFMRVWRAILCALLVAFFFYMHSVKYLQTFNLDCAAPGMLTSDRWDWDFILQAFYGLWLITLLWASGMMLDIWYRWEPYAFFIGLNAATLMWLFATGIYLSVDVTRANTSTSSGNAFNDFRICGVFGSIAAFQDRCKLTGPYTPGVTEAELGINGPKIFQLVFHWIFFVMAAVTMIYVPTSYKQSQLEMGKGLPAEEPLLEDENGDGGTRGVSGRVSGVGGNNNNRIRAQIPQAPSGPSRRGGHVPRRYRSRFKQ